MSSESPGMRTLFFDASPCLTALNCELNFPMSVLGPVLFLAFARFALICLCDAMLYPFLGCRPTLQLQHALQSEAQQPSAKTIMFEEFRLNPDQLGLISSLSSVLGSPLAIRAAHWRRCQTSLRSGIARRPDVDPGDLSIALVEAEHRPAT